MLVESNERVDDEQRVKSEPVNEWVVIVLVMLVVDLGENVVSEISSEESREMDMIER